MQFTGKITVLWPIETIATAGWDRTKRTVVLEETRETQYPGGVAMEQWGEKAELFSSYNIGDVVTVSMNCRAKEYNWRYYNSISAWKVEWENAGQSQNDAPAPASPTAAPAAWDANDDLPF